MKSLILATTLPFALVSLTGCLNTANTQTNTTSSTIANTYPVASVLKKAKLAGYEKTLITDLPAVLGMENANVTMTIKRDAIDPTNPQMTSFNNQQVIKTNRSTEINMNGRPLYVFPEEEYIFPDTFVHAGVNTANYDIDTVTAQYTPPATAVIGSSGKLYEGHSSALEDKDETTSMVGYWELHAVNDSTAELCEIERHEYQGEGSTCYTINQQGDILKSEISGSFIIAPGEPPVNFVSE